MLFYALTALGGFYALWVTAEIEFAMFNLEAVKAKIQARNRRWGVGARTSSSRSRDAHRLIQSEDSVITKGHAAQPILPTCVGVKSLQI